MYGGQTKKVETDTSARQTLIAWAGSECCSGKVRETVLEENGKTKTKDLQTGDGYNRPATATTPTFN
jgi:hypothetical protein